MTSICGPHWTKCLVVEDVSIHPFFHIPFCLLFYSVSGQAGLQLWFEMKSTWVSAVSSGVEHSLFQAWHTLTFSVTTWWRWKRMWYWLGTPTEAQLTTLTGGKAWRRGVPSDAASLCRLLQVGLGAYLAGCMCMRVKLLLACRVKWRCDWWCHVYWRILGFIPISPRPTSGCQQWYGEYLGEVFPIKVFPIPSVMPI